jgi:hypothetical protein
MKIFSVKLIVSVFLFHISYFEVAFNEVLIEKIIYLNLINEKF